MTYLKGTRITWLGHATVLVQTAKGTNLLIDPFIENNPKYPKGFELPERIHYVLLTHGHGDHVSDAVPVAKKHKSPFVPAGTMAAAAFTRPSIALSVEANGSGCPHGNTVRNPSGARGTTVALTE